MVWAIFGRWRGRIHPPTLPSRGGWERCSAFHPADSGRCPGLMRCVPLPERFSLFLYRPGDAVTPPRPPSGRGATPESSRGRGTGGSGSSPLDSPSVATSRYILVFPLRAAPIPHQSPEKLGNGVRKRRFPVWRSRSPRPRRAPPEPARIRVRHDTAGVPGP